MIAFQNQTRVLCEVANFFIAEKQKLLDKADSTMVKQLDLVEIIRKQNLILFVALSIFSSTQSVIIR